MYNHLTKALLGPVDLTPAENTRITTAILGDSLLYNRVMQDLIFERGPAVINEMHPLEKLAFQRRVKYVPPAPQLRIVWPFVPPHATASQDRALLRARRYFGDSKTHEEQLFWRPMNDAELA